VGGADGGPRARRRPGPGGGRRPGLAIGARRRPGLAVGARRRPGRGGGTGLAKYQPTWWKAADRL